MGRSISPMCETTVTGGSPRAAPRLIVPMSLRLAIPRRVALQQSSPPLHQPTVILKQKERLEKENPLNGKCASFRLSQLRGSPHESVAKACRAADTAGALGAPPPHKTPRIPKSPGCSCPVHKAAKCACASESVWLAWAYSAICFPLYQAILFMEML